MSDDNKTPIRAFNPWRFPSGEPAVALIRHIQATCEGFDLRSETA